VIRGDVNWIRHRRSNNIQDGSVLHVMNDTHPSVGDAVTVGHGVILHGWHDRIARPDRHGLGAPDGRESHRLDCCRGDRLFL